MNKNYVIAAVRDNESLLEACKSKVSIIFDLAPNIEELESRVSLCNEHNKTLFVHIDMAEGIGKDRAGLKYVKEKGVAGIISTRANLIKTANDLELKTVHRIFLIDSQSVETAITLFKIKPDMAEIMPGIVTEKVIKKICQEAEFPVIAGGLIETREEVAAAINAGVIAVSTGKSELWNI
jgi:glycerol uptake operon antiterminator